MKKNHKLLTGVALALILCTGMQCQKEEPANPDEGLSELQKLDKYAPISQEGKNTFGCLVEGKLFLPKDDKNPFNSDALTAEYLYDDSSMHVVAINYLEGNSINFHLDRCLLGKHKLENQGFRSGNNSGYAGCIYKSDIFETTSTDTGIVEITRLDLQQQIVAGKFWFKAAERINDTPKVVIKEGRFDLHFIIN